MATKKELRKALRIAIWQRNEARRELTRITELHKKQFRAMHMAEREIARMKRQMEPRITMLDEFGKANFSIVDDERAPPEVLEVINKLIQTLTIKK